MKQKEIRFHVSDNLYKRYKIICVEKDLSLTKQSSELIRKFVEIQEENKKRLNIYEKDKK